MFRNYYSTQNDKLLNTFESTDQELAIALKEMRDQEKMREAAKFAKYSSEVPKLDLEKVQEIIRLKCEESNLDSYTEEEEEENSQYDQEGSDRLSYDLDRYYSERNEYDDFSEDAKSDAKNDIKALLQNLPSKSNKFKEESQHQESSRHEEKPHLFDYEEKKHEMFDSFDHQNTIDQWEFEENPEPEESSSIIGSEKYMLYDDSSSSAGSYYSDAMLEGNSDQAWLIPKLNLGGFKIPTAAPPAPVAVNPIVKPQSAALKITGGGLNLEGIKQKDFQDEFMENYNEFSDSWREQIDRQKRF